MKKSLILLLSGTIFSSTVNAGGQAVIPHFLVSSFSNCSLSISNISTSDVQVDIELIDQTGTSVVPSSVNYYAFEGKNPVAQSVTLGAKKTGAILFQNSQNWLNGYGYISWTSSDLINGALVANMHCNNSTSDMQREVTINGGKAF